jgi:threonine/homoserine/homoserine lactone efflux protein
MIELFLRSLLLGFAIAAPVGPIGLICINRTLRGGLVQGLAAATADAAYGIVAALGLSLITQWLTAQSGPLAFVGGILLCSLGVGAWRSSPTLEESNNSPASLLRAYGSVVLLTITNPMTILSFIVLFGGLTANIVPSQMGMLIMPVGVFVGSALWWLTLSGGVSLLRRRLRPVHLRWLNRLTGLLLIGFGAALLLSLLRG